MAVLYSAVSDLLEVERVQQDLGRPLESGEESFTHGLDFSQPSITAHGMHPNADKTKTD